MKTETDSLHIPDSEPTVQDLLKRRIEVLEKTVRENEADLRSVAIIVRQLLREQGATE